MKVAILGYDVDGGSSAGYWHRLGAEITICDQKTDLLLPSYVADAQLGENYLANLDRFDLLVRTPGLKPDSIVDANPDSPNILNKVTTTINEFFEKCPAPIIGVTGTKGKGTSSTLIYKMLEAAGKKTFLGGNIGTVPLDFLAQVTSDSYVVLELSSFQLVDFKYKPSIGVCLMVVPDHLDWHSSKEEYFAAKAKLYASQTPEDRVVYNSGSGISTKIIEQSKASKIPYFVPLLGQESHKVAGAYVVGDEIYYGDTKVCDTSDVVLLGRHNLENVCAAISAVWSIIDGNTDLILKVVREFTGLPYRLELVRELNGVKYYNDSFATTPETTIAAVRAIIEPKVLILGGYDKGIPFFDLAGELTRANLRQVITIGTTGPKIAELLRNRGIDEVTEVAANMTDIVKTASQFALSGDAVLLSTACASFDMFKDYEDRGNQFNQSVAGL